MNQVRRPFVAALAAAVVVLASCESGGLAPTEPPGPPDSSADLRRRGGFEQVWLMNCTPLPADSASEAIGPDGGVIAAGPHRLVVPSGALDEAVQITMLVPSDTVARVQLLPEGLEFERRATLELSYAHCAGAWIPLPRRVVHLALDLSLIAILQSLTDVFDQAVSARLDHFSDYAVAW